MMSQQCFFYWNYARAHTDALVSRWYDTHAVQRLEHAPYSPNIAPTDFVLLKKKKMGAGRPGPGPGQLQERLGGGRQTSDRRRLRRRLQKLGGVLQKARSPRCQVRRKILRNKHPPSSNPSQFIDGFAFDCIHTSYIYQSAENFLTAFRDENVHSMLVLYQWPSSAPPL
jgi:hypothetical protein